MRVSWTVATLLALIAAGWSGAWLYGRQRVAAEIDPALARLADKGLAIDCPDRRIGGYPLAVTVSCPSGSLRLADGTHLVAERIDVGVDVRDWHAATVTATSPLKLDLADGRSMRLADGALTGVVRFDDRRPTGFDLTTTGLDAEATLGGAALARLKIGAGTLSLRADGDTATADLAIAGVDPVAGSTPLLPAPADIKAHLTLTGAAELLSGKTDVAAWAAAGGKLVFDAMDLSLGKVDFTAHGEASVAPDGSVNADIATVARGTEKLPATAAAAGRKLTPATAGLGMAYMFMGKKADGGGRRIDVSIREGVISAGGRQIAELPPLF